MGTMGTTFHVYNVSDDALHPTVRRSASKVLTRAITSKIDITVPSFKLPRSEEYDPHKHRNVAKPTTYGDTMMHLLKACFGAGLLALPNAMYRLGIVFGSLGVALLGFFACYCIQLLILAQYTLCKRKKVGYLSFPATMRVAVAEGPPFMRRSAGFFGAAVETLLIIWQFGVCAIFLVFISENLKQIITSFGGSELNIRILICCLYPPLVAICMIKDLKMLVPLSTFSNVCNLFGIILIFYYLSYEDIEFTDRHYQLKSVMDIPVFIGLVLFAIEAVAVVLALEYNMENPKEFTGWLGLFSIATIIIVVIYTGFGFFGYLKYGDECKASITLNLPQDEKKAQVAKGAFALTIFTSYPLQNFVAWQLVWALLEKRFNSSRKADLALRVVCSSGPFVMALAAPALGPFIGLLGSFCLSTAAIIFPAIVDICVYYPNQYGPGSYKLLTDVAVILVGIVCCVSGVYTSVLEMNDELS